jgi:NADH:ubiquinone oxidoreductase subunit 5 (subunit L)/multisubunit Na+/H+ antiporter MnhA subunit
MEVAWTTILVIALLLPGVFFFIGFASGGRYARETVKSSALDAVGWAVFISIVIHLLAWGILSVLGFDLAANLKQIADHEKMQPWLLVDHVVRRIFAVSLYILITALAGLGLGCVAAEAANRGWLPFLVTHKWINQVRQSMKDGLVTAYVMTNTTQNNKVLMYKGILAEFFQKKEGQFEYVVLRGCSSYFMTFDDALPQTGTHRDLFANHPERSKGAWDFLQIEGSNIANILFDPSQQLLKISEGEAALDDALKKLHEEIDLMAERIPSQ